MAQATTAKIQGKSLVITTPLFEARPSASGKTMIVASTGSFIETEAKVNGRPVRVALNAVIKP